jgi:hypothetical protein
VSHRTSHGITPSNGASASMPVVPVRGGGGANEAIRSASSRGAMLCMCALAVLTSLCLSALAGEAQREKWRVFLGG